MNNLLELFLPIKGDRQPFQPGQPHQLTQAELEKARPKYPGGFAPLPKPQLPPPPNDIPKVFNARAVLAIFLLISLLLLFFLA